jgi:hypothetical protein
MSLSNAFHWFVAETLLALLLVSTTASSGFAAEFNDGGVHIINSYVVSPVQVYDGPGGMPTTLNVVPGGDIASMILRQSSRLNVSGGSISHAIFTDSATGTVSAGDMATLTTYGTNTILVSGGEISHINLYGTSRGTVLAGDISHVAARESSVVDVFGGTYFTASSRDLGLLRFHSGEVRRLVADYGTTNLYGGNVTEFLTLFGGTMNIFGRDLKMVGNRVVGTLLNHDPIDVPITFNRGQVNLHIVPEPSTISLIFAGAFVFLANVVRKRPRLRGMFAATI